MIQAGRDAGQQGDIRLRMVHGALGRRGRGISEASLGVLEAVGIGGRGRTANDRLAGGRMVG